MAQLPGMSFKFGLSKFSPDGRFLVLYGYPGASGHELVTRIFDWRRGETIFAHEQILTADREGSGWIDWSPDSRRFTVRHHVHATGFRVYDATSGKQIRHVKTGGPYWHLDFHPNGKLIAGAFGATVQLLDAETGGCGLARCSAEIQAQSGAGQTVDAWPQPVVLSFTSGI